MSSNNNSSVGVGGIIKKNRDGDLSGKWKNGKYVKIADRIKMELKKERKDQKVDNNKGNSDRLYSGNNSNSELSNYDEDQLLVGNHESRSKRKKEMVEIAAQEGSERRKAMKRARVMLPSGSFCIMLCMFNVYVFCRNRRMVPTFTYSMIVY